MDSLENPCNVSAGAMGNAANVILDPSFNAFTYPAGVFAHVTHVMCVHKSDVCLLLCKVSHQ